MKFQKIKYTIEIKYIINRFKRFHTAKKSNTTTNAHKLGEKSMKAVF